MAFNRPTITTLLQRVRSSIETRLPGTDAKLRRTVLDGIANAQAGVAHGVHGHQQEIAKQMHPATATDDLELHADWWGYKLKPATPAKGNVTFTGTDGVTIYADTTLQRSDGTTFTTDADGTIATGSVLIAVTATDEFAGSNGNTAAASTLSLVSPIPGVQSDAVVDASGLGAGVDQEDIEALRARLKNHVQEPPQGGADADYKKWALEIAGVTRAWVYPLAMGLGTVTIRFMMDETYADGIPLAADVTAVQDYIDSLRPTTADIYAVAPVAAPLDLTIQLAPNTASVQQAVTDELADLLKRKATPGGTILLSELNEAISLAQGETDHVLTIPAADVTHAASDIAVPGTITFSVIP